MTSTDPLNLDAIEARANAATPGPWCTDSWEIYQGTEYEPGISFWIGETCRGTSSLEQDRADAAFVAAARTDVEALLAEVRRLRARVTELEGVANCQSIAAINGARCSLTARHRGDHHTADRRHYWSDEHAAPAVVPAR